MEPLSKKARERILSQRPDVDPGELDRYLVVSSALHAFKQRINAEDPKAIDSGIGAMGLSEYDSLRKEMDALRTRIFPPEELRSESDSIPG